MKVSRLNSIEQYVISRETVSIDELCEVFGVSKNTIRRDLNELEQRGHIRHWLCRLSVSSRPIVCMACSVAENSRRRAPYAAMRSGCCAAMASTARCRQAVSAAKTRTVRWVCQPSHAMTSSVSKSR